MRIALVVERFIAAGGGVEQTAWQVAHGLARAGEEVHVLARHTEGAGDDESRLASAPGPAPRVQRLRVPRVWQPLRVAAFARATSRWLTHAVPAFDVVHSFTRTRRQDVYRAGGGSHADAMLRGYGRSGAALRRLSPRHRILLAAESRIFRDPHQWIQCVSAMVRDELAARFDLPAERMVVIHNGVDCQRYRPRHDQPREAAALRGRHAAAGDHVWLFAGSGARRKGLDTALASLAACDDARTVLWVAGRDAPEPWRARAHSLGLAKRVHFLGPRSDMPAVYAAADGLLHPTRYDAFANVCLEAAASGLPVVTSASNGAAEILGEAAVVVADAEDHAGFARALGRLADAERRAQMGALGRSLAEARDWDDHIARLRALYGSVLEARERRGASARRPAR